MAINLAYAVGNNVSIGATETSLATDGGSTSLVTSTDAGVYTLVLDGVVNMAKTLEYTWKVKEHAVATATSGQRIMFQGTLSDAQSELLPLPNLILGSGWDITLQRTDSATATDRSFTWSIRRIS